MAVTYTNYFNFVNIGVSNSVTISNFIYQGTNKVAIAFIITVADDVYDHPTHDSVETYLRSFTKFRTDDLGNCRISYWYLIGGDDFTFKTIVATVGSNLPAYRIYLGCHTVYNAYQSPEFIHTSAVTQTNLAEETVSAVNGAMMLSFAHTLRQSGYATPVPGTGITIRGSSGGLPVLDFGYGLTQYREYLYGGSAPITTSSADTSWSSVLIPEQYVMSGIMVMPLGWTKPDWFDLIGDYVEPPCGYVGQVVSSSPSLTHLEGQTVSILANGEVLDQQEVVDGAVTFPSGLSTLHIGLPFIADLETLNIKVPLRDLSEAQNIRAKVANVTFHLLNSRGGWIGPDTDNLWEAFTQDAFRQYSGQNLDETEMFSGKIRQPLGAGYDQGGRVCVRQYDPLPITVGAIMPEVDLGGVAR